MSSDEYNEQEGPNLSADAIAILEFTSDFRSNLQAKSIHYITSKEAYVWAGLATLIARKSEKEYHYTRIEDITISTSIYSAVNKIYPSIAERTSSIKSFSLNPEMSSTTKGPGQHHMLDQHQECFSIINNAINFIDNEDNFASKNIEDGFADRSTLNGSRIFSAINGSVKNGYNELLHKGYICDPVIETATGIAILSIVPFSFVRRTKKGQLEYQRIQAALWKYEWARSRGDTSQTKITLEVARIAKVIKASIVAAYHQATKGDDEEPPSEV